MKKLNKLFAILVAMAMVLSLTVISAFAATETSTIAVTKQLNASNDILPNELQGSVTINFTFKGATGSAATNSPQVTSKTKDITIAATENKVVGDGSTAYYYSTGELTPEFFGLTAETAQPGVYTYEITETDNGITAGKQNEDKNGSETTKKFTLTVLKSKTGTFTFSASEEGSETKTEIKPGQTNTDIQGNGLAFKNNLFDKLSGDSYANAPFKMMKTVTDTAGVYNNEKFNFDFTVVLPEGADDTYVETSKTADDWNYNATTRTITGSVALGDGENFYFTKIPAGSKVSALENDDRVADAAKSGKMYYSEDKGEAAQDLTATGVEAAVTNISDKEGTTEGVLINSIPYIVLALVAIGGMAAYVIVRRRNADEA